MWLMLCVWAIAFFLCAEFVPYSVLANNGFGPAKAFAAEAAGGRDADESTKRQSGSKKGASDPLNSQALTRGLMQLLNPDQPPSKVSNQPSAFSPGNKQGQRSGPVEEKISPPSRAKKKPSASNVPSPSAPATPASPKPPSLPADSAALKRTEGDAKSAQTPSVSPVPLTTMPSQADKKSATAAPEKSSDAAKGKASGDSQARKEISKPEYTKKDAAQAETSGKASSNGKPSFEESGPPAPASKNEARASVNAPSAKSDELVAKAGNDDSTEALARRNIVRAEILPASLVLISAPHDGVIAALTVRDGDTVTQGQAVIRFDMRATEHALAQAKAAAAESFERLGTLPVGPSRERDDLAAEYLRHTAFIRAQESKLEQASVSAPFAGKVTEIRTKVGAHVREGDTLLEIAENGSLEVLCTVPSSWLRWLKPGYIVWVYVEETAKSYEAVLTRLGGKVDSGTKTLRVYARFSGSPSGLLPGMSGSASIRDQFSADKLKEALKGFPTEKSQKTP